MNVLGEIPSEMLNMQMIFFIILVNILLFIGMSMALAYCIGYPWKAIPNWLKCSCSVAHV